MIPEGWSSLVQTSFHSTKSRSYKAKRTEKSEMTIFLLEASLWPEVVAGGWPRGPWAPEERPPAPVASHPAAPAHHSSAPAASLSPPSPPVKHNRTYLSNVSPVIMEQNARVVSNKQTEWTRKRKSTAAVQSQEKNCFNLSAK